MTTRLSRRQFGRLTAAGSLGYLFTASAASLSKVYGANEKLHFAGIGIGGKGGSDIDHVANLGEIVALCDVDSDYLGKKTKLWPTAKGFSDFRKLFDDPIMKTVDAVTVSTPDHNHALATMLAVRMGKHVYCQKPLTHTVFEARLVREAAKKYKVCTQMGNQGTTENGLRRGVEIVQSGLIGDVKEAHVWTNRPIWPQAPMLMQRPKEDPVPKYLDWDCWLGPMAQRPYSHGGAKPEVKRGAYHDFKWRGFWDFGTGAIGDMACHTANMAFMALKLGLPTHVSAEAGDVNPETCPSSAHVVFEFGTRGNMVPTTLHWYEGKKDGKKLVPPTELVEKAVALDTNAARQKKGLVDSGSIIVGTKGIIYSPSDYGAEVFIGPVKDFAGVQTKKPETMAINNKSDQGQKDEWVAAIRAGKPEIALSNFDYASHLTETFLLGNVAIRSGKAFDYDGETGQVKNAPEAQAFLHTAYRKGWDLLGDKA